MSRIPASRRAGTPSSRDRIADAIARLGRGWWSTDDIAGRAAVSHDSALNVLAGLVKLGTIERRRAGHGAEWQRKEWT